MNIARNFRQRPANNLPSHLAVALARNIKRLRLQRDLTPERLAEIASVDFATLRQMEAAQGEPSLALAWQIADALDIPFAALFAAQAPRGTLVVRHDKAPTFVSDTLGLISRPLMPYDPARPVEFYELRLAPGFREHSAPHPLGTSETLHVSEGEIQVTVGNEPIYALAKGDTVTFPGDLAHSYFNPASLPAILYLVMTYADRIASHANANPAIDPITPLEASRGQAI